MTRKVLITLAILAIPLTAIANVQPYAGFGVADIRGSAALYDTSGARNHFSYRGNQGGAFFGLRELFYSRLWLAVEAGGDFSSARTPTQTIAVEGSTTTGRLRARRTYGLSLLPGIKVKRFLLYGRAGIIRSEFEYRQPTPPTGSSGATDSTKAGGVIFGGGLQIRVSGIWHLRAEYDREVYKHFSTFGNRIAPLVANQYRIGIVLDLS